MAKAFLLSDADRQALVRLLADARRRQLNTQNRPYVPEEQGGAPEVYVARVSTDPTLNSFSFGGLADIVTTSEGDDVLVTEDGEEILLEDGAGTGTSLGDALGMSGVPDAVSEAFYPGHLICDIYRILDPDYPGTGTPGNPFDMPGGSQAPHLELVDLQRKVYFLSTAPPNPAGWVVVSRDKFGSWLSLNPDRTVYVDILHDGQIAYDNSSGLWSQARLTLAVEDPYLSDSIGKQVNVAAVPAVSGYLVAGTYRGRIESLAGPFSAKLTGTFSAGNLDLDLTNSELLWPFAQFRDQVIIKDNNHTEVVTLLPAGPSEESDGSYSMFLRHDYTDPTVILPYRIVVSVDSQYPFVACISGVYSRFDHSTFTTGTAGEVDYYRKFNAYSIGIDLTFNSVPSNPRNASADLQNQMQNKVGPNQDFFSSGLTVPSRGPFRIFEIHGYNDFPINGPKSLAVLYPISMLLQPNFALSQPLPGLAVGESLTVYLTGSGGTYLFTGDMAPFLCLDQGNTLTFNDGGVLQTVALGNVDWNGAGGSVGIPDALHRPSITLNGPMKALSANAIVEPFYAQLYWFDGYASSLPFWGQVSKASGTWRFFETDRAGGVGGHWSQGQRCNNGGDFYVGGALYPANNLGVADNSFAMIHLSPMAPSAALYGADFKPTYVFYDASPGPPSGASGPAFSVQFNDGGSPPLSTGDASFKFVPPNKVVIDSLALTGLFQSTQTVHSAPAGSITDKLAIYNGFGVLVGYIPIYS